MQDRDRAKALPHPVPLPEMQLGLRKLAARSACGRGFAGRLRSAACPPASVDAADRMSKADTEDRALSAIMPLLSRETVCSSIGAALSAARVQQAVPKSSGNASLPRCPGRSPKGTSQTRCGRAPRPFATLLRPPPRRAADTRHADRAVLYAFPYGVIVRLAAGCFCVPGLKSGQPPKGPPACSAALRPGTEVRRHGRICFQTRSRDHQNWAWSASYSWNC